LSLVFLFDGISFYFTEVKFFGRHFSAKLSAVPIADKYSFFPISAKKFTPKAFSDIDRRLSHYFFSPELILITLLKKFKPPIIDYPLGWSGCGPGAGRRWPGWTRPAVDRKDNCLNSHCQPPTQEARKEVDGKGND
jgi:hypothetical protein